MPSLQTRFFNKTTGIMVRRRRWGNDEYEVASTARRLFGSGRLYQWVRTRGLLITPVNVDGVKGEWLEKPLRTSDVIMYIHGGGFVSCSAATHRPITAALAKQSGRRVFSVDYRLAPEHRFPAAVDDVVSAYKWLLDHGITSANIAIAGDSAGGSLVLTLLQRLRDGKIPIPAAAVCFSPWSDLAGTGESVNSNDGKCVMFRPENMLEFAHVYLGGRSPTDPECSPFYGEFYGLPPILLQVGSTELLLDDARRVHQKIIEAGGSSKIEIYDDVLHCWQMLDGIAPEAREAIRNAISFIEDSRS